MTKKEFAILTMTMKTYFHKEKNLLPNEESMKLWYEQLKDIPYKVADVALSKWVSTNQWSPSIADIREMAASVLSGEQILWSDGWNQVLKAIRKYGRNGVAEAMTSFDLITKATVERLDFIELCNSTNIAVDRANFRIIFEQLAERQKKQEQIQVGLTQIINRLQTENRRELQHSESKKLSITN